MKTYAIFDDSFFQKKPNWMPKKLYRIVCHRANPRSKEYMLALLAEKFPDAEIISMKKLHSEGKIILLYPDAIGIGWKKYEKKLLQQFSKITILNGRKRIFDITSVMHKKLLLHRFFEITFFPEIIFTPFFLLYGMSIALMDKFKGL